MKEFHGSIEALHSMKKIPETLFYEGNIDLIHQTKISIVGTRKPNQYTKERTFELASKLSNAGVCIVSGAAMGVDAIAHKAAGSANTIAVMANGLDSIYPKVNRALIESINTNGLSLSQFRAGFKAAPWSFVVRNELVVALSDVLIVTQADLNSGTMRSVAFAQSMGRKIYVLPHRLGESEGTQQLLSNAQAEAIYDIDAFVARYGNKKITCKTDDVLEYCKTNPSYDDAIKEYGETILEYELEGKLRIENGRVNVV